MTEIVSSLLPSAVLVNLVCLRPVCLMSLCNHRVTVTRHIDPYINTTPVARRSPSHRAAELIASSEPKPVSCADYRSWMPFHAVEFFLIGV